MARLDLNHDELATIAEALRLACSIYRALSTDALGTRRALFLAQADDCERLIAKIVAIDGI